MADLSKLSDTELTALLKAGNNHAAFAAIFDRYHPLLVTFAAKRIHNLEEAEDIVQEVFVWLWDYRYNFELKVKLSSYLYRATLNRLLNLLKHHATIERYAESLQSYLSKGIADADYLIREKDINKIIEKEISLLPPKTRAVFEMRRNQQMSNREIAEALDLSEQTVETHMKKALKALRMRLGLVLYLIYIFWK